MSLLRKRNRMMTAAALLTLLAATTLLLGSVTPSSAGFADDIPTVVFGPIGVTPQDGVRLAVSWMATESDPKIGELPLGLALVGPDGTVLAQSTVLLELGKSAVLELAPGGAGQNPSLSQGDVSGSALQITGVLIVDSFFARKASAVLAASLQMFDGFEGRTLQILQPGGLSVGKSTPKVVPYTE